MAPKKGKYSLPPRVLRFKLQSLVKDGEPPSNTLEAMEWIKNRISKARFKISEPKSALTYLLGNYKRYNTVEILKSQVREAKRNRVTGYNLVRANCGNLYGTVTRIPDRLLARTEIGDSDSTDIDCGFGDDCRSFLRSLTPKRMRSPINFPEDGPTAGGARAAGPRGAGPRAAGSRAAGSATHSQNSTNARSSQGPSTSGIPYRLRSGAVIGDSESTEIHGTSGALRTRRDSDSTKNHCDGDDNSIPRKLSPEYQPAAAASPTELASIPARPAMAWNMSRHDPAPVLRAELAVDVVLDSKRKAAWITAFKGVEEGTHGQVKVGKVVEVSNEAALVVEVAEQDDQVKVGEVVEGRNEAEFVAEEEVDTVEVRRPNIEYPIYLVTRPKGKRWRPKPLNK